MCTLYYLCRVFGGFILHASCCMAQDAYKLDTIATPFRCFKHIIDMRPGGLYAFGLMKFPPSEYQICLWCAAKLPQDKWVCPSCRNMIKDDVHYKEVQIFTMAGRLVYEDCKSFPGSLALRDLKVALCPAFNTKAFKFIQIS